MENKKYYFSVFIQDSELVNELDGLRFKKDLNLCKYAVDMFCGVGFEEDKDNFTDFEPYCAKGSDFIVSAYEEYKLLCNNAIGGVYMLYRKATEEETEWLEEQD